MYTLDKVISGAQVGADEAGLRIAQLFRIPTGGTMPYGFKTLEGKKPEYASLFGVVQHVSANYPPRTFDNVKNSDGTLRLAFDFESPGEKCTLRAIEQYNKPYFDVLLSKPAPIEDTANWIIENKIKILNIAGNTNQHHPTASFAAVYLIGLFRKLGYKA